MSKWAQEDAKISAEGSWSSDTKKKVLDKLKEYEDLIFESQNKLAQTTKALNEKIVSKGSPSTSGKNTGLNTSLEEVGQTTTMKVNRLDPNTPVF